MLAIEWECNLPFIWSELYEVISLYESCCSTTVAVFEGIWVVSKSVSVVICDSVQNVLMYLFNCIFSWYDDAV